ncbi:MULTISPECIES: IPT/TIG domain-containing protein [Streptomyces]|uniref:IPT/TIG domain-containing protein n=1 Tax=Streptomyces TaxID=1883 RepID=UPI0012916C69|nr:MULTISPECIES: IPT/TIG domain-containing protein [Streptomyces]MCX5037581.1 IPT/TIG domain-containing protein [Streptomyces coelicoflavus]QFX83706.1 hypothetical protein GEV49_24525 [Streptomyces sp. SYP-A7193]
MHITHFTPQRGPVNTPVTLTLTGLPDDATTDNTTVHLNGLSTLAVTGVDPRTGSVTVTVEANSHSGDFTVVVLSPGQGPVTAQGTDHFDVTVPDDAPKIDTMRPDPMEAPGVLSLTGRNLHAVTSVFIGTTRVYGIQAGSTTVRLTVPSSVRSGSYRVAGQTDAYGTVYAPGTLRVTSAAAEQEGARP